MKSGGFMVATWAPECVCRESGGVKDPAKVRLLAEKR